MIPPADVLAAAAHDDLPAETALAPVTETLVPLGDAIRNTLADIALIPVALASPEQRTELVKLREEVSRIARDAQTWVDAIDLSFRHAAATMKAKEIPLADGVVRLETPRGEWRVDVPALHRELNEFAKNGGQISEEEIGSIFKTTVEEKADGTRLNYFARNRGDELAALIERHRTFVEGNPLAAKVKIVRRDG